MGKKKVCIMGDNFNYSTGNARVIRELARGLTKLPCYDVYHIAIGPDGIEKKQDKINVLPVEEVGFDDRSVFKFLNKITQYIEKYKFNYMIILGDAINYQKRGIGNLVLDKISPNTKVIFWETVDSNHRLCLNQGYNMQNPRKEIYNICEKVVTTSHYGKEVLENEFVKVDKVIWEFTDTDNFTIIDKKKKEEIRKEYRFRVDDFLFLMVGRNIRRKNNELAFSALYPLMLKNDDIRVFCLIPDYARDDENNLSDYIHRVLAIEHGRDFLEEGRIVFCTKDKMPIRLMEGISDNEVIRFHQISDAYISATSNEGYNLNFGEALSTGHPYVGINNTTLPELSNNGEFAYVAPIDFEFNVGFGMKIATCKEETLRLQAKKCYDEWNIRYSKQAELDELEKKLQALVYMEATEDEKKELNDKIKIHEETKKKEQSIKLKEQENKKVALRKYVVDNMTIGKCVAEWHKFLKSIDGEKEVK